MLRSFRRLAGRAPAAQPLWRSSPGRTGRRPSAADDRHVVAQPVDVTGNLCTRWTRLLREGRPQRPGRRIANPALIVQAVSGHTVDFGSTSLMSIARAHLAGIDVVLVAPSGASSIKAPLEGSSSQRLGIKTAKDLAGKTMVVSVLAASSRSRRWRGSTRSGDWKSIKWVEAPPPPTARWSPRQGRRIGDHRDVPQQRDRDNNGNCCRTSVPSLTDAGRRRLLRERRLREGQPEW